MTDTLAIILGGGQGSRLFPLTATRSKPAVPIGGKYRLIDIPISGCLHADIRRIFVLTQFNSASLNRHISNTYRLDRFSGGFVEILAAEQTPDNPNWYQGTADAVRQAARHFVQHEAKYDLILAGDHLYRMDYDELIDAHRQQKADITIAAQPVDPETATQMGIFRFDRDGGIVAFEEKPKAAAAAGDRPQHPDGATFAEHSDERPFMASMGIYVFSRRVLHRHARARVGTRLRPRADPGRARQIQGAARILYRGYWADVGTIESFYDANVMLGRLDVALPLLGQGSPDLHAPAPPARVADSPTASVRDSIVADGLLSGPLRCRRLGGRRAHAPCAKAHASRARCCSAPTSTRTAGRRTASRLGIGRDVVLDRVIVDKNARIGDGARLVNERQRRACRRRRLLHPRRHHRGAEGRRDQARDSRVATKYTISEKTSVSWLKARAHVC